MNLDRFQQDLPLLSADEIYNRHILTGSCAAITDDDAHQVRGSISTHFSVNYSDVIIVGSANLGFSIKPQKRYIAFGEDSDVDVAIVSPNLYDKVWQEVFLYSKSGAYWPAKKDFMKYHLKGWIRPDLLPNSEIFQFSNNWWDHFRTATVGESQYKVTGGIYYSHFFLKHYQLICIEQCISEI